MAKSVSKSMAEPAEDGYEWRTLPEIAVMFDLSEERCRQFIKAGIWERREDGRLRLKTCINMYELFLSRPSLFRDW